MAAHCRVDSVCRAGEAAVEEGGYGAVAAAQRPAGSAIGRFARSCAVLAVAALAVAALAGASGDTKPAGLAATWGYAGTGAHTLVMLRQRDIGSLLDHAHQLELEATEATVATTEGSEAAAAAGEEAASSPASVAESAEPTEADEDPSLVAMGVKDVPVPTLEPRALVNGVEPGAIALYPGEPDPDANGSQADLDIMHDIEQDEMERPPPGYQGMISMNFDGKKVKVLYGAGWKPWVPVEKVDWNGPVGSAIDTQDKPKSAAAAARAAADMAKENAKESGGK